MYKRIMILLMLLTLLSFMACKVDQNDDPEPDPTPSVWTRMTDMTSTSKGASAFVLGGNAYLISGMLNEVQMPDVYQYNAAANSWIRKRDFPGQPRVDASSFIIGDRGYVAFGGDNNDAAPGWLKDIWSYQADSDTWDQGADFPGEGRLLVSTMVIGQKVYFMGGLGENWQIFKDVWSYTPASDSWEQLNDFPGIPVNASGTFVIDGIGYICCGGVSVDPWQVQNELWAYDAAHDRWTRKSDFPGAARAYALGFAMAGKGYVGFGTQTTRTPMVQTSDMWCFDPSSDTWTREEDMPGTGRSMAVCFVIGDNGYVGLGGDSYNRGRRELWRFSRL